MIVLSNIFNFYFYVHLYLVYVDIYRCLNSIKKILTHKKLKIQIVSITHKILNCPIRVRHRTQNVTFKKIQVFYSVLGYT